MNATKWLVPRRPDAPPSDGRRARGQRSRDALLTEAVQLASVEGLEGLTSARLADRLGVAKSSVHAAFGSKESLRFSQHTASFTEFDREQRIYQKRAAHE